MYRRRAYLLWHSKAVRHNLVLDIWSSADMFDTMTCDSNGSGKRVDVLFQRLFQASPEMLKDTIRRGELPKWDSLGHLELLAALEKEFSIDIPPDEVLAMETIGNVKQTVVRLCQKASGPK